MYGCIIIIAVFFCSVQAMMMKNPKRLDRHLGNVYQAMQEVGYNKDALSKIRGIVGLSHAVRAADEKEYKRLSKNFYKGRQDRLVAEKFFWIQ